jgi:hypothetical protein
VQALNPTPRRIRVVSGDEATDLEESRRPTEGSGVPSHPACGPRPIVAAEVVIERRSLVAVANAT